MEILGTSLLDEARYPDSEFAKLYAQRWAIEGDFRIQKARLQLENFTGKLPHDVSGRPIAEAARLTVEGQSWSHVTRVYEHWLMRAAGLDPAPTLSSPLPLPSLPASA